MEAEQFLTFLKFNDKASAIELGELLTENNIEYLLDDQSAGVDPFTHKENETQEFRIKLKKDDFDKADKIVEASVAAEIDNANHDHYLYTFTDEELLEIITKSDEWSKFDFLLAQKILKSRGKEVNPEIVEILKKQRIEQLGKPEESQIFWIISGYAAAIAGGLMGIFIGWHLSSHKKTLPNGDRVYAFSKPDRNHGFRILLIGIVFQILWIFISIYSWDN